MESTRQKKVGRLIQKELAIIFQQESRNLAEGKIVTVTVVHVTPDLALAKVYLSVFPGNEKEKILDLINEKNKWIRHELSKKIRHQIKGVPELNFYIDDSLDYVENIERLLKE
jgi:ribosome-binding factor A